MMEYYVWLQSVLKAGSNKVLRVLEKYGSERAYLKRLMMI